MTHFLNYSPLLQLDPPVLWHHKRFRLHFTYPGVAFAVIYYHNGLTKPWYRRTERPYRFKRLFFRSGKSTFNNIASLYGSDLHVLLWEKWYKFPSYHQIKLNVRQLETILPDISVVASPSIPKIKSISYGTLSPKYPQVNLPLFWNNDLSTVVEQNLKYPDMSYKEPDDLVLDQEEKMIHQ